MPTREQRAAWGKMSRISRWGNLTKEDLYWAKVKKAGPDECWLWTASVGGGYGVFRWHGRTMIHSHRAAYIFAKGPIPKGKYVCHSCDTYLCCNPAHLWVGTQTDNMSDCAKKGRIKHTLTKAQALEVRQQRGKETARSLAERLGVTESCINHIWHKRVWKHATE